MTIYKYEPTGVTTVSTTWSANTLDVPGALLNQVFVVSATSDTTYDFEVIDSKDRSIRSFVGVKGTLNDLTPCPVEGIYTAKITNASRDEGFTVLLCFREK